MYTITFLPARQVTSRHAQAEDQDESANPLRLFIERFAADRSSLIHFCDIRIAEERQERLRVFFRERQDRLAALNFDALSEEGQIDYILLRKYLAHSLEQLAFEAREKADSASYIPFAATILDLEESRRKGLPVDSQRSAATLTQLKLQIDTLRKQESESLMKSEKESSQKRRVDANRAADEVELLRKTLHNWYAFYDNYDPLFTWWNIESYRKADAALNEYGRFRREKIANVKSKDSKDSDHQTPAADRDSIEDEDKFN